MMKETKADLSIDVAIMSKLSLLDILQGEQLKMSVVPTLQRPRKR